MMRMQKSCANCCQQFNCSLIVREIIIEIKSPSSSKSQWKSVKVNEALSSVYKFGYLNKLPNVSLTKSNNNKRISNSSSSSGKDDENAEIAVCGSCADLLSNLYKFHEQLTQRRQTNSYVANKIDMLDTFLHEIQRTWSRMVHDGSNSEEEEDDDDDDDDYQLSSSKMNIGKNDVKLPIKSSPPPKFLAIKPQQTENEVEKPGKTIFKFTNGTTNHLIEAAAATNNETVHDELHNKQSKIIMKMENVLEDSLTENLDHNGLSFEEEPIIENFGEVQQDDSMDLDQEDDPLASNFEDDETYEDLEESDDENDLEGSEFSTCALCSKSFLTAAQLSKHLFSDHVEPDSKTCPVCFKFFAVSWYMRSHLRTHAGDKPFKCTINGCKKSFTARCNFQRHVISSHQHLDPDNLPSISSIKKPARTPMTIVASPVLIVNENGSNDGENGDDLVVPSMQCPLCDSEHVTATDLGNHLFYDHTPKDSVDCVVCHRNVHHRGPLKIHILRHVGAITGSGSGGGIKNERAELMKMKDAEMSKAESGIVPLTKATATTTTTKKARPGRPQKRKIGNQSGQKKGTLECPACGLTCHCLSTLKIHMRVHTGEKPFKCKLCDYSCAQSNNMSIHMRVHVKRDKKKGRLDDGDDLGSSLEGEGNVDTTTEDCQDNNNEPEELDNVQNLYEIEMDNDNDDADADHNEEQGNFTEKIEIVGVA